MRTTRIDGKRWFDLGADVNWQAYGGTWGRPMPTEDEPDRWGVIRLDTEVDDGKKYAVAVHVRASEVKAADLDTCGVPHDGLDQYGGKIPAQEYDGDKVYAYISTWGSSGPAGGDTFADGNAAIARARAARYLE